MGRYRKLLSNSVQLENKGRSRCGGLRNSGVFSTDEKLRASPMGGDYSSYVLFENLNGLEPVNVGEQTEARLEILNATRQGS